MHEKSTVSSPIMTLEEAAEALSTTPQVIRFLVAHRRITYIKVGKRFQFHRDDVATAITDRDSLINGLTPELLNDRRVVAFESDALSAVDIAQFFHVRESDVRMLFNLGADETVGKSFIWNMLVTGYEDRFATLHRTEQRLAKVERLRATSVPKAIRAAVRDRDHDICRYCGQDQTTATLHIDHVVSRSRGGLHDMTNLVVACVPCNSRKGERLPHEVGLVLLPAGTRLSSIPASIPSIKPPRASYSTLVSRLAKNP